MGKKTPPKRRGHRLNISITGELKEGMDQLPSKPNWSKLVSKCIEEYILAELSRKPPSQDGLVMRLRASKRMTVDDAYQRGRYAGEGWATEQADYAELLLLEERFGDLSESEFKRKVGTESPADGFLKRLDKKRYALRSGRQELKDRWGLDNKSFSFVMGFAHGAIRIWREVKDLI